MPRSRAAKTNPAKRTQGSTTLQEWLLGRVNMHEYEGQIVLTIANNPALVGPENIIARIEPRNRLHGLTGEPSDLEKILGSDLEFSLNVRRGKEW